MRCQTKWTGRVVGVILGLLFSAVVVLAGGLEPLVGPTAEGSQMYTLDQIYNRINNGTTANKMTEFTEPSSGPTAPTMHTLDDIYSLAGLRAPVPRTGQTPTLPFGADAGSDGALQKGVAWPNPRFTVNMVGNDSFKIADGTVTDNLTGLIWLKNADCNRGGRNWPTALSDVAQININGKMNGIDCGDISRQTDWRLPNVKELLSLIDWAFVNPALSNAAGTAKWTTAGGAFTGVQSYNYWSSTTLADSTANALVVSLDYGGVGYVGKAYTYYVWPVRGGQ